MLLSNSLKLFCSSLFGGTSQLACQPSSGDPIHQPASQRPQPRKCIHRSTHPSPSIPSLMGQSTPYTLPLHNPLWTHANTRPPAKPRPEQACCVKAATICESVGTSTRSVVTIRFRIVTVVGGHSRSIVTTRFRIVTMFPACPPTSFTIRNRIVTMCLAFPIVEKRRRFLRAGAGTPEALSQFGFEL